MPSMSLSAFSLDKDASRESLDAFGHALDMPVSPDDSRNERLDVIVAGATADRKHRVGRGLLGLLLRGTKLTLPRVLS